MPDDAGKPNKLSAEDYSREARALVMWTNVRRLFPAGVMFAALFAAYSIGKTAAVARLQTASLVKFLGMFVSPYLLANLVGTPLRDAIQEVHKYIGHLISPFQEADDDTRSCWACLYAMYRGNRDRFSDQDRRYLESKLECVDKSIGRLNDPDVRRTCDAMWTVVQALPKRNRVLTDAAVSPAIARAVRHASEHVQYTIKMFASDVVRESGCPPGRRARPRVLYFLGPPGTGKTRMANRLAAALGLPIVALPIDSDNFPGSHRNGTTYRGGIIISPSSGTTDGATAWSAALQQAECTNAIVFIDEADKTLNADAGKARHLLKLFDGDCRVYLNDLDYYYHTAAHTFFLAGNAPLDNDALRNRMLTVPFEGFDIPTRAGIAATHFQRALRDAGQPEGPESSDVLTEIIFHETDCGIRSMLQVIDLFAQHLLASRAGYTHDHPFDVARAYAQFAMT
jgi:hypothetical protein